MLRVRVGMTGPPGAPYVATHYFAESDATAVAAATAAVAALWGAWDAQMTNQITWEIENEVTVLTEAGTVTGSFLVDGQTGTGSGTSEPLPIAAQALCQWRTGVYLAGREVRGRTFIPGLTSGANDDGMLLQANRNLIDSAALTYVGASGCTPVVWSRARAQAIPISGGFAWSQFAMLTSRRD